MTQEEKSVLNLDRLVRELIESEKYDRALIAARRGIKFIEGLKISNLTTDLVKSNFKVIDHLLSPFYPEDQKGNYAFETDCKNNRYREMIEARS